MKSEDLTWEEHSRHSVHLHLRRSLSFELEREELAAMARSLRSLARFAGAARVFRQAHHQRGALLARSSSSVASSQLGAPLARYGASLRFMSADHTAKWMQNTDNKKSPMELINEVPPIEVDARIVACEGGTDPALGHPIEYICLDGQGPQVCKYCGLRYFQGNAHGHH